MHLVHSNMQFSKNVGNIIASYDKKVKGTKIKSLGIPLFFKDG